MVVRTIGQANLVELGIIKRLARSRGVACLTAPTLDLVAIHHMDGYPNARPAPLAPWSGNIGLSSPFQSRLDPDGVEPMTRVATTADNED